jgi:hypothetical protein
MAAGAAAASASTAAATSSAYNAGVAAGTANTAAATGAAYNAGVAVGAAGAAPAPTTAPAGAVPASGSWVTGMAYATLPAGSMAINKSGQTYYLNGNTWFKPAYGANGVFYTVVPTP